MNRDQFRAYLERSRREHPTWFDLPTDRPPDARQLAEIEGTLGAQLPGDYRWFLQEFGGGDFAFATIYSADPDSDLNIKKNQPTPRGRVVAFSDDGTGNLFVFPVDDARCEDTVLMHDHEAGEVRATNFQGFLDFVVRAALQAP